MTVVPLALLAIEGTAQPIAVGCSAAQLRGDGIAAFGRCRRQFFFKTLDFAGQTVQFLGEQTNGHEKMYPWGTRSISNIILPN